MSGVGRSPEARPFAARSRRRGLDRQRQLTILQVDLVGSTPLAEQVDPEDLRDILLTYHDICDQAVDRYGGLVGSRAGDGLMVHFGLPHPHEDDAQRAVLAGLAVVEATVALSADVRDIADAELDVRVGIHTGSVIVTEIGRRTDVVGAAANLAARIESAAEPGSVTLSDVTRQLVTDVFDFHNEREVLLKGFTDPMVIVEATRRAGVPQRGSPVLPFVGRRAERSRLIEIWDAASHELGDDLDDDAHDEDVVPTNALIVGEAGMGKTRLAELISSMAARAGARRIILEHHSYDTDVPFHAWSPVITSVFGLHSGLTRQEKQEALVSGLDDLDLPDSVPYLATLVGLDDDGPPGSVEPAEWQRSTMRAITSWVDHLLGSASLVIVAEDIHWADPSSLGLIDRLMWKPRPGLMVIVTGRDTVTRWDESRVEIISLDSLSAPEIESMGRNLSAEMPLADEVVSQLIDKSDGVPLYLDRLFDLAQRSELFWDSGVPAGLDALLASILDTPGVDQQLLGLLATIGRRLDTDFVAAVLDEREDFVREQLEGLTEAGLLERIGPGAGASYRFHHAMMQTAAYEGQLASDRRAAHGKVAGVLERRPSSPDVDAAALARHFDLAGRSEEANAAYLRASKVAHRRGAGHEAQRLAEHSLRLVDQFPEGKGRDSVELRGLLQLAQCVLSTEGYGAQGALDAAARARELIGSTGDALHVIQIQADQLAFYSSRGESSKAALLLEEMHRTAHGQPLVSTVVMQMEAMELARLGRLVESEMLYTHSLEDFDERARAQPHVPIGSPADAVVSARCGWAPVAWQLGAEQAAMEALELAVERSIGLDGPESAFSEGYARSIEVQLKFESGELESALELARDALTFCNRKGLLMWGGMNHTLSLIVRAHLDPTTETVAKLERAIERHVKSGTTTHLPLFMGEHAHACALGGRHDEAVEQFDRALDIAAQSGERRADAHLHRRRALAKFDRGADDSDAAADLRAAIDVAAQQTARQYGAYAFLDLVERADDASVTAVLPTMNVLLGDVAPDSAASPISRARATLTEMGAA